MQLDEICCEVILEEIYIEYNQPQNAHLYEIKRPVYVDAKEYFHSIIFQNIRKGKKVKRIFDGECRRRLDMY